MDGENKGTVQITVKVRPRDYESLKKLSATTHKPMAELIRKYISDGMNADKTSQDIDFIRHQIREEMELVLKPQINRIAKLLMRIGMMSIAFCYFTSKIIYHFVPFPDRQSYDELMREAKHNAAAYLNVRDASLDAAFREFDEK